MNKDAAIVLGVMVVSVGAAFVSGLFVAKANSHNKGHIQYLKGMNDGLEMAKNLVSNVFDEETKARTVLKETIKETES